MGALRVGRPNIARSRIAASLAPGDLRCAMVVYRHIEVVAIGQAKTAGRQVAIAWDIARHLGFATPCRATITAGTIKDIPAASTHIHPGNTHIATTRTCRNRWERMLDTPCSQRNILACRVDGTMVGRFGEVDAFG